jgi:hypothetical protein
MTPEQWFEKFADLSKGDVVSFHGLELRVWCVMSYGGCVFTEPYGEIIPRTSRLWLDAEILGKSTHWMDSTLDEPERADWWKE